MLDIKFIRENPNKVKEGAQKKGVKVDIDQLLELDQKIRELKKVRDELRRGHTDTSTEVGENILGLEDIHGPGPTYTTEKIRIGKEEKEEIKNCDKEIEETEKKFNELMRKIPNLPLDEVPVGRDEKDNVVLREEGKKPKFSFKPKDYLELAERLDLIDVRRAAKTSGARFGFIKREAVSLEFALINLAFSNLIEKGFIPILPPVMLRSEMARGMGYLEQADKNEAYYLPQDDLFLAGTAEQPLGIMHANEIFNEKDLPRRYVGFSTCFRREAGSYGKDTKGIFRVHQFDKVEMFSFCRPEESKKEHQFLLSMEEKLMKALKIPYRVVQMCTADIAFPQVAKYDIETWLPAQGQYRETHSTSSCTDFQARRLSIRYKDKSGKLNFVHTLNGTAFAIGRTLIAIIENYQQKDGSIMVPQALQKYTNFKVIK